MFWFIMTIHSVWQSFSKDGCQSDGLIGPRIKNSKSVVEANNYYLASQKRNFMAKKED